MATCIRGLSIPSIPTGSLQRISRTTRFGVELLARVKLDRNIPRVGRWMRTQAEEFGPLFVKMMQMIAVRGKGLDEKILVKLRKLQDDVLPFDCSAYEDLLNAYGASSHDKPLPAVRLLQCSLGGTLETAAKWQSRSRSLTFMRTSLMASRIP
jgi:hypothetical protein